MSLERINPVAIVTGAASGAGFTCVSVLSEHADGGLILADEDEGALERAADALTKPPERVSTLAFPAGDSGRWSDVIDFIATHYGRLDYAVITAPPPIDGGLADLDTPLLALQALTQLLGENNLGGAAVLVVDARAVMKASLLQVLRTQARECARSNVRFNILVCGAADAPAWRSLQAFHSLERPVLETVQRLEPPAARAAGFGVRETLPALLSDRAHMEGAALVVDGDSTV